jgi:DNA-binding CsgD family transcriptional regulator
MGAALLVNSFFRDATQTKVSELMEKIILSDRQEAVFRMFYLKRNSAAYIADKLNVSEATVYKDLVHIRRKLIACL